MPMKSLLFFMALAAPVFGQVSIVMQTADHAAIPGSVRSLYANVQGTPNIAVRWSTTGGCTLASATTTGAPQVVTAPAVGGMCKISMAVPTNVTPNFISPVSCTVTATSVADGSKSATTVIPVCGPAVSLSTFPRSTVLYKNQFAVIQTNLRGSVDTSVTWAVSGNPGGAGSFTGGATNRHAVFSAKAPGTYVVTATSVADAKKKASSTIIVTAHDLPSPNADHTESVDCTAVGKGKTYEVGPAKAFHDLNAVPWNSLKGGDTVRIHNEDVTGSEPTTYHQHVAIGGSGSATEPLRICGVPDARGNKPIVDGSNATTRPDADWAGGNSLEPLGVWSLYDRVHKFDAEPDSNQNIVIEGLHIRNAKANFNYLKQGTNAPLPYNRAAACIRVQTGRGVLVRGNEMDTCGQAVFVNSQTPEGGIVYDLTIEGNYIHDWGAPGSDREHAMYLQAIGLAVQFNYIGSTPTNMPGNLIKTRSVLNFLRWNYLSQTAGAARAFDMVEPQAFSCSVIPYMFAVAYHGGLAKSDCNEPHDGAKSDTFSANQVAANLEAYHSDFVYGNILVDGGSGSGFVHYGYDQQMEEGPKYWRRGGTLYFWNNTSLTHAASGQKPVFDVSAPDQGNSYEFSEVQSVNNIFAAMGGANLLWTRAFWTSIHVDTNWITGRYDLPNRHSKDTYQGGSTLGEIATCDPYGNCKQGNGHMTWQRDGKPGTAAATLYVGPLPFDLTTFKPSAKIERLGTQLPKAVRDQPSNMEYFPVTNTIQPRQNAAALGALD